MNPLHATIPAEVLSQIQGKTVIEAGVAMGPSYFIFKGTTFDPPVDLETGLDWILHTMETFKGAHLKLNDLTVLWFGYNAFTRYQKKRVKAPIRPGIRISGHKVQPFQAKRS